MVRRGAAASAFDLFNHGFMVLLTIAFVYPFAYVIAVSLSDPHSVMRNEVWLLPIAPIDLQGYQIVLNDDTILRSYLNTIYYCLAAWLVGIFLTANIAYGLSIDNLRGRGLFTVLLVIPIFFEGGLIPTVLTIQTYGLMNTVWALVLPSAVTLFHVVILRTNFQTLPASLRESASMDGANHFTIMWRIYLPLSKAILATLSLWIVVRQWNSFFAPLLYLLDDRKYPLQLVLRKLIVEQVQRGGASVDVAGSALIQTGLVEKLKMAAILVSIGPIILIYPFLQKYFIKGVLIGSIKG